MSTIIIKSNDHWTISDEKNLKLDYFQKIVGGYIEGISITKDIMMYCNEEGKILGLPVNKLATEYVKSIRPFNDIICGDVVFTKLNKEGDDVCLSLDDINHIIDFIEIYQNT